MFTEALFTIIQVAIFSATLTTAIGSGAFSVSCYRAQAIARMDPIVNPGALANHAHIVWGGNGFAMKMGDRDALNAGCTTCNVKADRSNYWIPQLYNRNRNGTLTAVRSGPRQPSGLPSILDFEEAPAVYYKYNTSFSCPGKCARIRAFPPGFRMLAGNAAYNRPGQSAPATVTYKCVGNPQIGQYSFEDWSFNKKYKCPGGIRAELTFPQCWDGKNLAPKTVSSAEGTKTTVSHVAYSSNSGCPKSHPVKIMQLFYEFLFYTDDYWEGSNPPQLVWATGDETGFGFHGDFFAGWDPVILQKAIDQCDYTTDHPYTGISSCPPLLSSLSFPPGQSEYASMAAMAKIRRCNIKAAVPKETVTGTLRYLLGSPKKYAKP
ncbi:hypothetical protein HDV00_011813 [Rhizophlyctis rosea]|nr:hypothetical protein HDV00_011813 [Rhizophlyctis rosea]